MTVYRTFPNKCVRCGQELDAAGTFDDEGDTQEPRPGDVTACINCGIPMVFTDTMSLAMLPIEELLKLPRQTQKELFTVWLFAHRDKSKDKLQ